MSILILHSGTGEINTGWFHRTTGPTVFNKTKFHLAPNHPKPPTLTYGPQWHFGSLEIVSVQSQGVSIPRGLGKWLYVL